MNTTRKITGGIYLVLDPSTEKEVLLTKLLAALGAGIHAVQLWNNWNPDIDKLALIESIGCICRKYNVPLLINDDWELLRWSEWLQGIHFDRIPDNFSSIKQRVAKPFISGITCSGNLEVIRWANEQRFDYVSFCSMFPSPSAGSCDIVMPATVMEARGLTELPIFVSGGITPENLYSIKEQIPFDGVAVISGIMSADHPEQRIQQYKTALGINQ